MYKYATHTTDMVKEGTQKPPFGPQFDAKDFEGADRMEVWASSFSDAGDDYCEFRIMNGTEILKRKKVNGF